MVGRHPTSPSLGGIIELDQYIQFSLVDHTNNDFYQGIFLAFDHIYIYMLYFSYSFYWNNMFAYEAPVTQSRSRQTVHTASAVSVEPRVWFCFFVSVLHVFLSGHTYASPRICLYRDPDSGIRDGIELDRATYRRDLFAPAGEMISTRVKKRGRDILGTATHRWTCVCSRWFFRRTT